MNSQIIPVNLDYKIENSPFIIEGQVLDAISKQDKLKTTIFTDYRVKIILVKKGNISSKFITIRNLGGTIGENTLKICPNSSFEVGDKGIYFISKISDNIYEPSFLGQSEYIDYKLDKSNNNKFELKANTPENRNTMATITSISPLNVNAGVGDVITITGTGFGTGPPSGQKVLVPRANLPGQYITQGNLYNYVSWTDTEIKYKVSSDAASGPILVGYLATNIQSTQSLQINYNVKDQFNANLTNIYPIVLPALNNGGIEFVKNTNFINPDAINVILIAMDNWTCNTTIKLSLNPTNTVTNTNVLNDGNNVLFFANLGATVLGITYSNITSCSLTGKSYVSDIDLGINSNQPFNYTLSPTISGKYDYFNVVLHELGHVRNLGHVGDTNDIMYPSLSAGIANRSLNTNNTSGGLWVQNMSQTVPICSKPLMTAGTCLNLSNNVFNNLQNKFETFPNPVTSILNIEASTQIKSISITDTNGRIIFENQNDSKSMTVNTEMLSSGMYLLKVTTENESSIQKIIKQ